MPVDPYQHVSTSAALRYASPLPLAFWPSRLMRQALSGLSTSQHWDVVVALQTPVAQYALMLDNPPKVIDADTALSYQIHERYVNSRSALERIRN